MIPRENKNNAYAKFGGKNEKYYGIIPSGQFLHSAPLIYYTSWSYMLFVFQSGSTTFALNVRFVFDNLSELPSSD